MTHYFCFCLQSIAGKLDFHMKTIESAQFKTKMNDIKQEINKTSLSFFFLYYYYQFEYMIVL